MPFNYLMTLFTPSSLSNWTKPYPFKWSLSSRATLQESLESKVSCKIALEDRDHLKGYGFIQFDNEEVANRVIK
jgi:hypothetical protein